MLRLAQTKTVHWDMTGTPLADEILKLFITYWRPGLPPGDLWAVSQITPADDPPISLSRQKRAALFLGSRLRSGLFTFRRLRIDMNLIRHLEPEAVTVSVAWWGRRYLREFEAGFPFFLLVGLFSSFFAIPPVLFAASTDTAAQIAVVFTLLVGGPAAFRMKSAHRRQVWMETAALWVKSHPAEHRTPASFFAWVALFHLYDRAPLSDVSLLQRELFRSTRFPGELGRFLRRLPEETRSRIMATIDHQIGNEPDPDSVRATRTYRDLLRYLGSG